MLEGFINCFSFYNKDLIDLYINADSQTDISIEIIDKSLKIYNSYKVHAFSQKINKLSFAEGCKWTKNISIELKFLKPGLYFLKLYNGTEDFLIPFIIKNKNPEDYKQNLVILNTNTWCAYNNYGGASFYYPKSTEFKNKYTVRKGFNVVGSISSSFFKPFVVISDGCRSYLNNKEMGSDHLFFGESILFNFLNHHNIGFDYITDREVHDEPHLLENRKIIFLNCHPEYWTHQMFYNFTNIFKNSNTNLIYLGGNGIWRKILYKGNSIEKLTFPYCNNYLNIYNNHLSEDLFAKNNKLTDQPYDLLGMFYDIRGYNTYEPFKFLTTDHIIFENTNIKKNEIIGNSDNIGNMKPSGHETDKCFHYSRQTKFTPNPIFIAKGLNKDSGGADIILHKFYNSKVFSCGSITFTRCINNPKITQLILNVINHCS